VIKRATHAMNVASGVIILISGFYIDYSFAEMLSFETRAVIGLLASLYAIVRLVPWLRQLQRVRQSTAV
jgi:cytochrome b subunit of formate dehydrogenase